MKRAELYKLPRNCATPRFRYGQRVQCEVRGLVTIVGLSGARIPWPLGRSLDRDNSNRALVIYGALAKAVRTEAAVAVCYWFGVTSQTVSKWRGAMRVGPNTEGSRRIRAAHGKHNWRKLGPSMLAKAHTPQTAAKIAAAKLGKPMPPHVAAKMRDAHLNKPLSAATRAKMSAAHKSRGTRPPAAGRAWTAAEDALLSKMPASEVAELTGRTEMAVMLRKRKVGVARWKPKPPE